ncbi:MAG: Hsp20/alpha crystallin family protein, partial [Chloroflexota bacterium]
DVYIPVDVYVNDDAFEISAFVPGIAAEEVKIEVLEDTVSIQGDFPAIEDEDARYLLKERPSGHFSRTLRLSTSLQASKAEAEVVNGVLTVRIPKAEEAKAKQIKVKVK